MEFYAAIKNRTKNSLCANMEWSLKVYFQVKRKQEKNKVVILHLCKKKENMCLYIE